MKRMIPLAAASLLATTMLAAPAFSQQKLPEGEASSSTTGEAGAAMKQDRAGQAGASAQKKMETGDKAGAGADTSAGAQTESSGASAGADTGSDQDRQAGSASGGSQDSQAGTAAGSDQERQAGSDSGSSTDTQAGAGAGSDEDRQAGSDAAGDQDQQAGSGSGSDTERQAGQESDSTTEQASQPEGTSGETTGSIDISTEQQTEIRTVFTETEVEPADVDIEVSVGTEIPDTVVLHPLPPRVIEIVPQYEGYQYFVLADGRIIIVEPDTMEIVYIITA
ncbi:MAG TPA: DUF1236 domain-containing protein [Rhizobiaceae bacterium]|nr:DUF1236 domain-containing protein [Rhizobiaceae bacterium]